MTFETESRKIGQAPPWMGISGLLLGVGILVCLIILLLQLPTITGSGGFSFSIAAPTGARWEPSASQYCVYIGDFNNPPGLTQTTTFMATLLADSAPTPRSRAAALRLYNALRANKVITQAEVDAVNGAYTCPSTAN
jgi:hypothetical protein